MLNLDLEEIAGAYDVLPAKEILKTMFEEVLARVPPPVCVRYVTTLLPKDMSE
jgi:hypothetical protein